jgi:hypothetical protein
MVAGIPPITGVLSDAGHWTLLERGRCVMRNRRVCVFMCVGFVWLVGVAAEAQTVDLWGTAYVNCDRGQSINDKLMRTLRAPYVIIVVLGTCNEDVVIKRDNLILRGVPEYGEGAVVAASSTAILLDGVSNVSIENLTVQGGPETPGDIGGAGIMVLFSTGVSVSNVVVEKRPGLEDEGKGMMVLGSTVIISDSTFQNNNSYGLQGNASSLVFLGDEVNFINNRFEGLLLSFQSSLISTAAIHANDNGEHGIGLGENSSATFYEPVEVTGNDVVGIGVQDGSVLVLWDAEVSENENGMMATNGGRIRIDHRGEANVHDNDFTGLSATGGGFIEFYGTVEENGTDGVYLHGSSATFHNVTIQGNTPDVNLLFGSRVDFEGTNTVEDPVLCDGTVLVEGDVPCS